MFLTVLLASLLCPQEVYPLNEWMPTPALVEAGPFTLQWGVESPIIPDTAQVEYSSDGVEWFVFDVTSWDADTDIFYGGYYRLIGLANGFPITEYSNVLQL